MNWSAFGFGVIVTAMVCATAIWIFVKTEVDADQYKRIKSIEDRLTELERKQEGK